MPPGIQRCACRAETGATRKYARYASWTTVKSPISVRHTRGRGTPLTRDFVWYGTYDVAASMGGYETTHTPLKVIAPWWQWPPIDLLVEILPIHARDVRHYTLTLQPASTQPVDPELMLSHAEQMR